MTLFVCVLLYLLVAEEVLWKISKASDFEGSMTAKVLYSLFWVVPLSWLFVKLMVLMVWEATIFILYTLWRCVVGLGRKVWNSIH